MKGGKPVFENGKIKRTGKQIYKAVEVSFSEKEWNYSTKKGNRKNELKVIAPTNPKHETYLAHKKEVDGIIEPYQSAINELISIHGNDFSFDSVLRLVGGEKEVEAPRTILKMFDYRVKQLQDNDQLGTASAYNDAKKKLQKFIKKDILIRELDKKRLIEFKKWMDCGDTTKRIYLTSIRAMFGVAEKKGIIQSSPFKDGEIFKGLVKKGRSIALDYSQVMELRRLRNSLEIGSDKWIATSYFMFGYLGRGINFQDIARLKWSDIKNGKIYYVRKKTKESSKEATELSFPIEKEIEEIRAYYRRLQPLHATYIFPILNESHKTEKSKRYRIQKILKEVNKNLKEIGLEMDLGFPLTSYVWRHTFASVAKNELRLTPDEIRELLDHSDVKITEAYLKNFDKDVMDKALAGL